MYGTYHVHTLTISNYKIDILVLALARVGGGDSTTDMADIRDAKVTQL